MIPLSLYIHIPWCIKKCPYCDFNSYALNGNLPETEYIAALIADLKQDLQYVQDRKLLSIFFGGGTPSLFSPKSIEMLLTDVKRLIPFGDGIEITLETNPGTIEHFNFADYKTAGVNRISLGAQSFIDEKLQALGRIHNAKEILNAIDTLHKCNFESFNIDIMHSLPQQTLEQAMSDLTTAVDYQAPHISWYQLTLEPNTVFHKYPPKLPNDDLSWQIQQEGEKILATGGFNHYEISAFAKAGQQCLHNTNYWKFGDYLGIGAGAHGKVTDLSTMQAQRYWKTRSPKDYLDPSKKFLAGINNISTADLPGEFMLNRLRLFTKIELQEFQQATGLPTTAITAILKSASKRGLIEYNNDALILTAFGKRFINDVMQLFI